MTSFCDMTIADPIIASKVRGDLCRADDIVCGDAILCMWQRNIYDLSSELAKFLYSALDLSPDTMIESVDEVLLRDTDSYTLQVFFIPNIWIYPY
jgi:hypothetical protein